MKFQGLESIDDTKRTISTALCRWYCRNGKDVVPSNAAWAEWRRAIGIDAKHKTRDLTMREAFLLCVRSRLRAVCRRVGMEYPKGADGLTIKEAANAYVLKLYEENAFADRDDDEGGVFAGLDHLNKLALFSDMSGKRVLEVAHKFAGECSISPSTVRRRLIKYGLDPLKMKKRYNPEQVSRYSMAIADRELRSETQ
ncbi:MAG: hypothetical protein ACRC1W_06350 [Shewanella sp.]